MNEGMIGYGEPISASGRASAAPGELEARFDKGIDLAKIRALLVQARERAGLPTDGICTMNLLAIHFSEGAYERTRPMLEAAAALHPARILSLIAEPKGGPDAVTARVSMVKPPGSPIPLERIVLTATGGAVRHLEPALTSLLVPEVPLVVVWGGRPEGDLLEDATEGADRVIIDSGTRPLQALVDVSWLVQRGAPIGDLAWARISPWQSLAAEVLDMPNLREHRGNILSARVTTAGEPAAEAALLAGWFASRVPKARVELVAGTSEGAGPSPEAALVGAPPHAERPLASQASAAGARLPGNAPATSEPLVAGDVIEVRFEAPPAVFTLRREKGILVAEVKGDDDGEVLHRVRLPLDTPGRLLAMELKLLSGHDEIYAAAVEAAARFVAMRVGQSRGER
jgi:glucose-6-phosphate dehydrogenase assembly protein OpcA